MTTNISSEPAHVICYTDPWLQNPDLQAYQVFLVCELNIPVFSLQDIPIPTLKEIFEAMKGNSHVEFLSIAATRSNDPVAYVSKLPTVIINCLPMTANFLKVYINFYGIYFFDIKILEMSYSLYLIQATDLFVYWMTLDWGY